jgi:hypothetical protein
MGMDVNEDGSSYHHTSRLEAMLQDMGETTKDNTFSKFVIFSQYAESLEVAKTHIEGEYTCDAAEMKGGISRRIAKYQCAIVRSSGGAAAKDAALNAFHSDPKVNVLLLLTGSAAAGLTLTVASTLYLMEPLHSVADEAQALSRVHRLGQPVKVRCVCFFAKSTIEERLLALRRDAKMLMQPYNSKARTDPDDFDPVGAVDAAAATAVDPATATPPVKKGRGRGRKAKKDSRGADGKGSSQFFTEASLQVLFGATMERVDKMQSSKNTGNDWVPDFA